MSLYVKLQSDAQLQSQSVALSDVRWPGIPLFLDTKRGDFLCFYRMSLFFSGYHVSYSCPVPQASPAVSVSLVLYDLEVLFVVLLFLPFYAFSVFHLVYFVVSFSFCYFFFAGLHKFLLIVFFILLLNCCPSVTFYFISVCFPSLGAHNKTYISVIFFI